jgi:hypothetical protein
MTTDILSTLGLGAIVTWDLQGTRITPADLRAVLAAEGLTAEAAAVPDLDPRNAVKRAAREWAQGRGNAARYRAEVVREDAGSVQVGILRHERVSQDEVRWVQVDTLTCDLSTGAWTAAVGLPEGADLIALATERATYLDHSYVRPELLQRKMDAWKAFPLRRQGGAYFIPAAFDGELQALQRVVGKLGDSALSCYHLAPTTQTTQAVHEGAREHAGATIRTLRAKITGWQERAGTVRSDAVAHMLEELRTLRGDVQFYSDSLQVAMDDMLADLDAAVADARALSAAEFSENPGEEVKADREQRTARPATIARWQAAIAAHGLTLTAEQGAAHGLPASAWKHHAWHNGMNCAAVAVLGYRSRLRDGLVVLTPIAPQEPTEETANDPQEAPQEASVVEPEVQAAPVVESAQEPAQEPAQVVVYDQDGLDGMPMRDALKLAKILGIKGTAKLGKAQLVQAILAAQGA